MRLIHFSGVILTVAASVIVTATAPVIGEPGNIEALTIVPSDEYPRNSEGSFVTLDDGRIVFAYTQFHGGSGDHSSARIVAIESSDGGLTWSDHRRILVENEGGMNVMSVSFLRLASGRIALFYLLKNGLHDCKPVMRISSDGTETWSEPRDIIDAYGYFVLNNDRVIQLESGRLVVPVAYHRPIYKPNGDEHADFRGTVHWYLSDDEGETWRESGIWWAMPEPVRATGFQEPGVVQLADGSIFGWARTGVGVQYGFRSDDGGESFGVPYRTSMVSPVSPASVKHIPGTNDLLAVWNDHSGRFPFTPGRRTPLVAAVSYDGGVTWPDAKVIEDDPDGHFCYTAIHFTGDAVLLAYCAGSLTNRAMYGLNPLRIRRMTLDWLKGG